MHSYRKRSGIHRSVLVSLTIIAALLTACSPLSNIWEWSQILTVKVHTPNGVQMGSAMTVIRVQERAGAYAVSYSGEATAIHVGNERYLFALVDDSIRDLALHTFKEDLGNRYSISKEGFETISGLRGIREVPKEYYPRLVTFENMRDPKTIQYVDPSNLTEHFGAGVTLSEVTLQLSGAPCKEGEIVNLLGWWLPIPGEGAATSEKKVIEAQKKLGPALSISNFDSPCLD